MKYALKHFLGLLTLIASLSACADGNSTAKSKLNQLKLPTDFHITIFADNQTANGAIFQHPRMMTIGPDGNLYVSLTKDNKVVMLPDSNLDGVADEVVLVAKALNAPHGLQFVGQDLLIANQDGVVKLTRLADNKNGWSTKPMPFISHLPTGGHTLKTIQLSPDSYLLINVGSSCNVCIENDSTRATILRYTLDGKPAGALNTVGRHQQSAIWATGLRNSQGFTWHPVTGEMFATNEGADNRSSTKNGAVNDELPPEHLNKIVGGQHYGWPYCWGNQVEDPNFVAEAGFCHTTQAPEVTFTSHTTPIGITFLNKSHFPADYQTDAVVALHGSWNRKTPAGYALVRVKFNAEHQAIATEHFVTGWLQKNIAWGRPVDVIVGKDGALYVSDDEADAIYRIAYKQSSSVE